MAKAIELEVRRIAGNRCEYCHLPESASRLKHVLDHIVARQHGGKAARENLALCCSRCNQHKGPNLSGVDPETGDVVRLFHPRWDRWRVHFRWRGAALVGRTPVGRATVSVLAINEPLRVAGRAALVDEGVILD